MRERSRCFRAWSEPSGRDRCESLRHRASRLASNVRGELGERIRRAANQGIQALRGERPDQTFGQTPQQHPERLLRRPDARRTDSCTACDSADHFLHAAVVGNIVDFVLHALAEDGLHEYMNHIIDVDVGCDRLGPTDMKKRPRRTTNDLVYGHARAERHSEPRGLSRLCKAKSSSP